MSEWITDRLPTEADAVADRVIVWDDDKGAMLWMYHHVPIGEPWMPIRYEPYAKPKRWTFWGNSTGWNLGDCNTRYFLPSDCSRTAAQRICDIFNEELP